MKPTRFRSRQVLTVLEIQTGNISYTALPTPTPEPLPRLELPTREPGFPFGEDFPFGNTTVTVGPTATRTVRFR